MKNMLKFGIMLLVLSSLTIVSNSPAEVIKAGPSCKAPTCISIPEYNEDCLPWRGPIIYRAGYGCLFAYVEIAKYKKGWYQSNGRCNLTFFYFTKWDSDPFTYDDDYLSRREYTSLFYLGNLSIDGRTNITNVEVTVDNYDNWSDNRKVLPNECKEFRWVRP